MANSTSLAFVTYPVSDMERAKDFYERVVGLGEPKMLHDAWAEFDLGNCTFALSDGGEAIGVKAGSAFSAAFEVEDVQAALERLRSHGVAIVTDYDGPTCRAAFARDPDGNGFAIHQLKT